MALGLRLWLAVALSACVAAGFAFAPGASGPAPRRILARYAQSDSLLREIRSAHARLAWLELRDSLLPEVQRVVEEERRSSVLLIDPRVGPQPRSRLDEVVGDKLTALRDLSGEGLLGIAVVVDTIPRVASVPSAGMDELIHILPEDAQNPCLSVAILRSKMAVNAGGLPYWWYSPVLGRLDEAAALVGPCALYVRFGQPGTRIRAWLDSTDHVTAMYPSWIFFPDRVDSTRIIEPDMLFWAAPGLVSCASGYRSYCRDVVLSSHRRGLRDARPDGLRVTAFDRRVAFGGHPFGVFALRYLSDLVLDMGEERFKRFWKSPLAVDEAFVATMGEPLEDWTMRWARSQVGDAQTPNRPTAGFVILAIALTGTFLSGSALWATRRQVS